MGPDFTFDFRVLYRCILWSTIAVVVLGLLRELYVAFFGMETAVKGLRLFSLDEKHSFQAWQQSSLSILGMLAAMALAASETAASGLRRYWVALVFVCAYISFDEQVSFHRTFIPMLHGMGLAMAESPGYWVIVGVPVSLALGAFFIPFFWKVPPRFAAQFFLSGILFAGASMGLEFLGMPLQRPGLPYVIEYLAEESLESIGLAIFAVTILEYWRLHRQNARITVIRGGRP